MASFVNLILLGLLLHLAGVHSLLPYQKYQEGPCSSIEWTRGSMKFNSTQMNWVNSLTYKPAGSKYHLYRMASVHHSYSSLTETEFRHQFCYTRDIFIVNGRGQCTTYGFGKKLAEYDVEMRTERGKHGIWEYTLKSQEHKGHHNPQKSPILWHRVTKTGSDWAFLFGCWKDTDRKVWVVASSKPEFDLDARRDIIDHAVELGFKRENFVFLDYEDCDDENSHHMGSSHKNRRPSVTSAVKRPLGKQLQQPPPEPQAPKEEQRRNSFVKIKGHGETSSTRPPLKRPNPVTTTTTTTRKPSTHDHKDGGSGWSQ